MCMYVCIYIYIYIYVCVCMCICIYIYIYICNSIICISKYGGCKRQDSPAKRNPVQTRNTTTAATTFIISNREISN